VGSDISRVRFDPRRDFAGVVLQQGRLLLDADFNEYVALVDRRLRAETCDLTSFEPDPDHAGAAWVPRLTPDAFVMGVSAGALTIGRGRMYVDGLLAENHGGDADGFDPLLSERAGTTDTPYNAQPYWPTPDPLPSGGPHLVYLDVWQREVTHLEDPGLVEVAVGVDTTARRQTVWQVRLLPDVGGAGCGADDADIPGWLDVIRPSAGRLTTDTIDVDEDDDPCELPPTGGYRGLENQTYRVEVHNGGAPGSATFKWSRDNGSVALPVVEMVSTTVLRLASVGRDDVLRVSTGDWVEILDDHSELAQRPGVMRKVTVDDAARTITFDGAIPSDLRPADADDAAARHLRVRRWDQSGVVRDGAGGTLVDLDQPGASGLIVVPAAATTQVVLEHGIVVSFSVAEPGGELKAGDHWVFAARTADTSIEVLDEAPPLGIHHHFARLAVVTFPSTATDCRVKWPPLPTGEAGCDCTVCVTIASHSSGALTIQAAVDQVKETGGTVCLEAGLYDVGDGIEIDQARSLRIRGQGPATILAARGVALTVTRSFAVTLENLAVVAGRAAPQAVRLRNVVAATVQDLTVLSYGRGSGDGSAIELGGVAFGVALRHNTLVGRTGVDAGAGDRIGVLAGGLRVEDNVVVGIDGGIDLGGLSAYLFSCRVARNEVVAGDGGGVVATGAIAPGGTLDVVGNKIATSGAGIVVGADVVVDSNTVNTMRRELGTDGIVVALGRFPAARGHGRITGNRVHDRSGTGIALRTAVRTLTVKENVLTNVGSGIAMEGRSAAERVAVENNEVFDVATSESATDSAVGIALSRADAVAVVGNTVARVAPELREGRVRAGILVTASADVRVSGNVVDEIGPTDAFLGVSAGVVVVGPFDRVEVSSNSIGLGAGARPPEEGAWHALLVQSAGRGLVRVGAGKAVVAVGRAAFVINGGWGYAAPERDDHVTVASNALTGGGERPTCLVRVTGDVVADANQCTHLEPGEPLGVLLAASSVTASTNRVRGGKAMLVLEVREDRFAAVGNLAAGDTHLGAPGAGLPPPWDALNPQVS
jgi:Family of unknown function (DUF6519)/Right handed beta helix region